MNDEYRKSMSYISANNAISAMMTYSALFTAIKSKSIARILIREHLTLEYKLLQAMEACPENKDGTKISEEVYVESIANGLEMHYNECPYHQDDDFSEDSILSEELIDEI